MKWLCEGGERGGEGGLLTGSWQHIVHISATICCNCANCNSLFRLSYGLFQAHHHICYIWYTYVCVCICMCVWQRCHCELTKCWAKYPQDMCLLISLETLTFYLHRLHGARGVVMAGRGSEGVGERSLVWNTTKYTNKARNEYYATLAETDTVADILQIQMEYLPPFLTPLWPTSGTFLRSSRYRYRYLLLIMKPHIYYMRVCACRLFIYFVFICTLPLSLFLSLAREFPLI